MAISPEKPLFIITFLLPTIEIDEENKLIEDGFQYVRYREKAEVVNKKPK
jgi:hypothetical protein